MMEMLLGRGGILMSPVKIQDIITSDKKVHLSTT